MRVEQGMRPKTYVTSLLEVIHHLLLDVAQCIRRVGGDGGEARGEIVVVYFAEGAGEGAVVELDEASRAGAGGRGGVFLGEGR